MRGGWRWIVLLGASTIESACTNWQQAAVQRRAAHDFYCPERDVQVRSVGGSGWSAKGCGRVGTYVCQGTQSDVVCVKDD